MSRVKRGITHHKRVKNVLKDTKGYRWRRKSSIKLAKVARWKAGSYAYRDRRNKKRAFKSQWIVNMNAALRPEGFSYSVFMNKLKKKNIVLDRKILATLAEEHPKIFSALIAAVKD